MKRKKIFTLICILMLILSITGCTKSGNVISGRETADTSGLIGPQSNTNKVPAIIGQGGVGVSPASEEESDGTMSYGALRLRVQDDQFEFSTDGGRTWSSDWEHGLPEGYTYKIEGNTLEVNTDDGCATITK